MSEAFPFGQDWAEKDQWLGTFSAKSRRWTISYDGNFSIVCGYHNFIFLGLDSLTIALVSLKGCGPSAGVPVGKIVGRVVGSKSSKVEDIWEVQSMRKISMSIQRKQKSAQIYPLECKHFNA